MVLLQLKKIVFKFTKSKLYKRIERRKQKNTDKFMKIANNKENKKCIKTKNVGAESISAHEQKKYKGKGKNKK